MTKQQLAARRQHLRELAEVDHANRCAYCRAALVQAVAVWGETVRYCSHECLAAAQELAELRARRAQ